MALGHPDAQELAAHFDGEGDRATAAHIETCDRCGARLLELRRLRAHLRSAPLPDPLEDPPPRAPSVAGSKTGRGGRGTNATGYGPLVLIAVILIVVLLIVFLI